nr:hypothetical protein [Tanacetum cinerariifolium]
MVNVLISMEATNILSSEGAAASVSPANVLLTAGVPTISGTFPTVTAIFTTASVENQRLSEQLARDSKIARIHAEEELKIMIEEKIELISELVKYHDHLAEILKYQAHQSKPSSKKEQRRFYMSVLKSHAGWKTAHFRGMTLEQIKENIIPVWKHMQDFVPMSSKEERSDNGVTTSLQLSKNSRPPMLDHQDKHMLKAQVHVSKSSAISDVQALPRRKHYCQNDKSIKWIRRWRYNLTPAESKFKTPMLDQQR